MIDWIASMRGKKPFDINGVYGAEMTAVGLVALESITQHKMMEFPDFTK